MKLISISDVEHGPVGQYGEQDALDRVWSFMRPDQPGDWEVFVESPCAANDSACWVSISIAERNVKPGTVELGRLATTGSMTGGTGYPCFRRENESKRGR
jgi:hypothetical protein